MKNSFKKFFIIGMIIPAFVIFIIICIIISYQIHIYNLKSIEIKKSENVLKKEPENDSLKVYSNSSIDYNKLESINKTNEIKNKINSVSDSILRTNIIKPDTSKKDTISTGLNLNENFKDSTDKNVFN